MITFGNKRRVRNIFSQDSEFGGGYATHRWAMWPIMVVLRAVCSWPARQSPHAKGSWIGIVWTFLSGSERIFNDFLSGLVFKFFQVSRGPTTDGIPRTPPPRPTSKSGENSEQRNQMIDACSRSVKAFLGRTPWVSCDNTLLRRILRRFFKRSAS